MQLGQAMRQRRMEEDLARAYGLTPQEQQAAMATPEQLQRAQAETQALQQQDIAEFGLTPETQGLYTQRMPQEGQRVGPSTYRIGEQTFTQAPTQAQIDAARMRAAADVYGQYGDAARREELMRGLRAEERAQAEQEFQAKYRPLQLESAQQAVARSQAEATERQSITSAREALAAKRKEGPLTAAAISEVAGQFKLDPMQFLKAEDAANTLEIKDLKRSLSTAALKGPEGLNQFLADKFDPDKTDNIRPTIMQGRDGSYRVVYGDRVLQEYGAHKNMMSLVGGVINMIDQNPFDTLKTLSTLESQAAAAEASRATVALRGAQYAALTNQQAGSAEAAKIREQFMNLTEEEQAGAKGQGLIKQFNMANAKAGITVPLGTVPRPERTQLSPGEVTNRAKAMVEAREVNPATKKPYTLTEAVRFVEGGAVDPADALIDAMRRGPQAATPAAGTAAGRQLVGLADVMLPPPAAPAPGAPTTSRERMRGLYLGQ